MYFRLNVLPIHIRPLRERPEDIPILAQHFLKMANSEQSQNLILLESSVDELKKLNWPGNVRELEHCIKFLTNLSNGPHLEIELLKDRKDPNLVSLKKADLETLKFTQMAKEKNIVLKAIEESGSISAASRLLNISRSTVREKMKKYGIELKRELIHGGNK